MKNLSALLSNEATREQLERNAVVVSKKQTSVRAEKTALNHSIIRKNELTDTARLDFILITALVLSDFHVTSQQCVALAQAVQLDTKRLQSSKQFEKHVKDDTLFSCENSLFTIEDARVREFYINAFYSRSHMKQLEKHATDLFTLVVSHIADSELIKNAHEQASVMNSEYVKKTVKKTVRKVANKK